MRPLPRDGAHRQEHIPYGSTGSSVLIGILQIVIERSHSCSAANLATQVQKLRP